MAIRNHDRPNSWSSLEQARSLRSLQKGSWHHSSGPVASGAAKGSYGAEGLLHTVIEKSPESSPTTKPRQGGGFVQPPSPPEFSSGSAGHTPHSGRLILPTVVYPVPQPEPHYAQMPSSNPGSGSSAVYPALTKENSQHQYQESQGTGLRDEGKISSSENNISWSHYPHSSHAPSALYELRLQQEESNLRHNRPHMKSDGDRAESQTRVQRPLNHQEPHSQSFQESYTLKGHGPHDVVFQEQNHGFHVPQIQSSSGPRPSSSHECRDAHVPVQPRDRSRSVDHTSFHTNPGTLSRPAQGQVPFIHSLVHPQSQAPPTSATPSSPRHLSDSVPLQYQDWDHRDKDDDREHPLTRLENALAEVQRCSSSDSIISASSQNGSQMPTRSLSVLEKVSRFERGEQAGKKRSYSTSHANNKATHLRTTEKGRRSPCGADDLRNMLERSTSSAKPHRTMSYRGRSNGRTLVDPSSALQRSHSTFQLEESREGYSSRDVHLRHDIQEVLGPMQDTSFNRSYRESLKDAQTKVLRSTSFRRRDFSSSSSPQPPPVPAKQNSLEKKGPKTKPKPHGVIIRPMSPPLVTSPHAPKERHMVTPEVRGPSPPALPSVPPVGPAVMRICGRKRLMAEQKKRSYSEPENLNEVGVSDVETVALFRRGGETSVADRRKMFELAASRVGVGAHQNTTSRPELRQLQHDALAEYVERKRGAKREDGGQRSGLRPCRGSCSYSDTFSLSSASSLLSLQEPGPERTSPVEKRSSSTLPPGTDLRDYQSNLYYPGRVTTPRPPPQPPQSAPPGSPPELQTKTFHNLSPEAGLSRQSQSVSRDSGLDQQQQQQQQQDKEPQEHPFRLGLSRKLSGALQRAGSNRSTGKSASAEDLLERSQENQMTPQHFRSRSSPIMDTLQDFSAGDVMTFGVLVSEPEDRSADTQMLGNLVCPQLSQNSVNSTQPSASSPDLGSSSSSSVTPITRRERRRSSERQRAHSTSTLAASVGLPCPFSSAGDTEWQASERLANLDAISFPGTSKTLETNKETRCTLSLEDTETDVDSLKNLSEMPTLLPHPQLAALPNRKDSENAVSLPSPSLHLSVRHLSSLRISESSLSSYSDQQPHMETSKGRSQEDFDEVFLLTPAPPSPPPPIRETSILEDFPPPPPPIELEEEPGYDSVESPSSEYLTSSSVPSRKSSLPSPTLFPSYSVLPPLSTTNTHTSTKDSLGLDYQSLTKREKTPEEQRVEALARKLVLQDHSLAPLLDTWSTKSTVELMSEIFPRSRLVDRSQWHQLDDRIQDGVCDSASVAMTDGQTQTNTDEKDLNTTKVELCEALRSSVEALQQEKELLCEEQRSHQALGGDMEALVQEKLRDNEKDKYSMFIGDLERIVNLLLSLCSRLSRIDRSLLAVDAEELTQEDAAEEKASLCRKRSLLLRQTEDAWELKENLDRRQRVVQSILSGYLSEAQLGDYRHFVSTKPSLLIRRRHLDDLIRQGEEQLKQLVENIPELAEARGLSRAGPFSLPGHVTCSSLSVIPGPAHPVRSTTVTSL
ncbi:Shroom3-like isoform X1 [Solea senegalensis]|nr:Shroom3-like isoform X1 [Solea senegalensis]